MKRSLTGFYIFTFSLLCQVVGAKETGMSEPLPPVYVEIFERLDNRKRETLKDFYGSVMAVAVFGIDCSWCKKQHRVLKKLHEFLCLIFFVIFEIVYKYFHSEN